MPFTLRAPTAREIAVLHAQVNQLAIADPPFVHAIALMVAYGFQRLLKTGTVVPIPRTKTHLARLHRGGR